MSEFQPPWCLEAESEKHPAQLFRQSIGTMLNPAGGTSETNSMEVTANEPTAMNVVVAGGAPPLGQAWVPGSSLEGTQGLYYCWNDAPEVKALGASSEAQPRIDTVVARVFDEQYEGAENKWELEVIPGTPEAGATLGNLKGAGEVPASCLVLAYVLVPAKSTKIENADIKNVAQGLTLGHSVAEAVETYVADLITTEIAGLKAYMEAIKAAPTFLGLPEAAIIEPGNHALFLTAHSFGEANVAGGRFVAPSTGYYYASAEVGAKLNNNPQVWQASIQPTGGEQIYGPSQMIRGGTAGDNWGVPTNGLFHLNAGDTLTLHFYNQGGANVEVGQYNETYMTVWRVA